MLENPFQVEQTNLAFRLVEYAPQKTIEDCVSNLPNYRISKAIKDICEKLHISSEGLSKRTGIAPAVIK